MIVKEDITNKINIEINMAQKLAFIYNALESGWQIKKKGEIYVFKKKHNNKREVFSESYLNNFINNNMSLERLV